MDRGYDTRSPIQKKSSLPRTFSLFRAYILVVFFLFGLSIFFAVAYAPLFKIRTVVIEGGEMTPHENIQAYISKAIEGNWHTVLPFDSLISIPVRTLEKNITKTFPSVESVQVDRVGLSQIHFSVVDRIPQYKYCKDINCVLVDQEGIIFAPAPKSFSIETIEGDTAEFARRSATKNIDALKLGGYFLQTSQRASLEKVRMFLFGQGFVVKKIQLHPLGFFDIFATYGNGDQGIEFRFRDNKKVDKQIEELRLALEKGLRQKISENQVSYVISYVPQKVIYKKTETKN